ncbi:MAG: hypothetical protein IAI49_13455 [Candidatus Eremiobacteraeota bacterium]|nr:hypothetical protein [Candidatus Eremiobacteraeota bacterium]
MLGRFILTPLAFATALLGASVGALGQSQAAPAPAGTAAPQSQSPNGGPAPRHGSRIRAALRSLDLTDDQKAQIDDVMRQFRESRRSQTPMTRDRLLAQITGVLTPTQQARFRAAMRRRRPGAGSPQTQDPNAPQDRQNAPMPQSRQDNPPS